MNKEQRKINEAALALDPERTRREARDARRREFTQGLLAIDHGVSDLGITPHQRLHEIIEPSIRALEKGDFSQPNLYWKTVEYIGSFDMQYVYMEPLVTGTDERTGEAIYEIAASSDSLDEVALTETLRALLTQLLAAGGALAKAVGSRTYENWVTLITDINFTERSGYHIFSRSYPFDAFQKKFEEISSRLWAEIQIAHAPAPLV